MALVVQKYGGSSVADIEKIENVARRVIKEKEAGNEVVVVLSAMAGETDRLTRLACSASAEPEGREYDALVSTGEQVTVALLAIVLNRMGYKARSSLASQVKIISDQAHKKARILMVETKAIKNELSKGTI
ncbi:MAG: aspartate kinase, partial [Syntrophales bacterium]|nr:aspartate kinase [Syntrophales bacterium]